MKSAQVSKVAAVALCLVVLPAAAQQKIGYVDSEYILEKVPEYQTIQQQVDRIGQDWQAEIDQDQKAVDDLFREFQARELLYTTEERQRRREAILQAEDDLEKKRMRYFGPEGQLFQQQEQLMRPLQERILEAVQKVAADDGYDYVFDKSGDYLFMFAREEFDLSNDVLRELGIDVEERPGQQSR